MLEEELKYLLALQQISGIGPVKGRLLLHYFKNAKNIFTASKKELIQTGLQQSLAENMSAFQNWKRIEQEILYCQKNQIEIIGILDKKYPTKLKAIHDAPNVLFYKGTDDINNSRIISIVGTRKNTDYGKKITEQIVEEFAPYGITIISGLAYGIDIIAHKAALKNNLATVGVLAHGLDDLYPKTHMGVANKMIKQGGLLTEYFTQTNPDRENFPNRNRIVAGLADALIVIETEKRGGSMITAELAFSYNKDIYALPGKIDDRYSQGCNYLIQQLKANIFLSTEQLLHDLNWADRQVNRQIQKELFVQLEGNARKVFELLQSQGECHIDEICLKCALPTSAIASVLLDLEMKSLLRTMPGKMYALY